LTATEILLQSGVLQWLCVGCEGAKATHNPEDGYQPCPDCNGTGFRFWPLRRPCPAEHWAGNMPEDCHGVYYPLPQAETELGGILFAISRQFTQAQFMDIAEAYWADGLENMATMFITVVEEDGVQC
jgi:hypothetical protein